MGDNLIAFVGADYVMVAADTAQQRSVLMLAGNVDKTLRLDDSKLAALSGPQADRMQFGEYIQRNLSLHAMRTGEPLDTHAVAAYTREELASALRKGPYQVNLLIAGMDAPAPRDVAKAKKQQAASGSSSAAAAALAAAASASKKDTKKDEAEGEEEEEVDLSPTPVLYTMDYLAASHEVKFGCQGYANYFLLGLFDKHYKAGMTIDEGLDLLKLCIKELKKRFVLNTVAFSVQVVDKDGIRSLDTIET